MFWKKKKTRMELLREAALERAQDAIETAQDVLHQASGAVHEKFEHAPEKIEDLKADAGENLGEAVSRVGSAVAALSSRVGDLAHVARQGAQQQLSHATEVVGDRAGDARHLLDDKLHLFEKKKAHKQKQFEHTKKELVREHAPEVVITDDSQKWLWLAAGVLLGVVVGILLAPASGRRNRALLRDKAVKGAHKAEDLGEAAARKARDLSNRAEGVAHKVSEKVGSKFSGDSDTADDITIADRVRTALGRLPEAQMLERINIDSNDGVVTLRGPVVDTSTQAAIMAAVGQVAGVREVISDLLIEDGSEDTFVG